MNVDLAAIGGMLAAVLAALGTIVARFLGALSDQRAAFITYIENHLEHQTQALEENTKVLRDLARAVRALHDVVEDRR